MLFLVSCYFMYITDHMWCYSWCYFTSCLLLTTCDVIPGVMLFHVYYCPPVMLFLVSCYFMFISVHLWCYSWCHVTSCLLLTTCDVIPGVMLLHVYYWPPVMLFLVSFYFMFIYMFPVENYCLLIIFFPSIPGVELFSVGCTLSSQASGFSNHNL